MRKASLIISALLLSSCCKKTEVPPPPTWQELLKTEGCLVGQQDAVDQIGEGSCLRESAWQRFIKEASPETVDFLRNKLLSTEPTAIHTCPYQSATEGELALYILQHVTKKLWKDYDGSDDELNRFLETWKAPEDQAGAIGEQNMIWEMLANEAFVNSLQTFYQR